MNTKENRFNPEFINKIHDALDEVEKHEGDTALITVSLSDKNIYSNGLDTDWWAKNPDKGWNMVSDYVKLLGRLQIFPCPTIAAIEGHAFAGGCMFAMAHDYRIMGTGKGFMCLPELDLNMQLPEGMTATCRDKVTPEVYTEMLFGKRFTAQEAESLKVITKATEKKFVFPYAMLLAKEYKKRGKNKDILKKIKYQAYKASYDACAIGETDFKIPEILRARL